MKTLLAATALVLSMTAIASAAETPRGTSNVLAGGPIYATNATYYYCWFINFGSATITPTAQLVFQDSTTAINSNLSCANGSPVPVNGTCFIYPQSAEGAPFACKVTFSVAATNVRGALQAFDSNYNLLSTVELR